MKQLRQSSELKYENPKTCLQEKLNQINLEIRICVCSLFIGYSRLLLLSLITLLGYPQPPLPLCAISYRCNAKATLSSICHLLNNQVHGQFVPWTVRTVDYSYRPCEL